MTNCDHVFTASFTEEEKEFTTEFETNDTAEFNTSFEKVVGGNAEKQPAVLYVEQELTDIEKEQARKNISTTGKSTTGIEFTPYDVDQAAGEPTPLEPVIADVGAEIYNDYEGNIATGAYSHAEGYQTQATGAYSRSAGWMTVASGISSMAQGVLCKATGHYAIAEGTRSTASKNNAHSEGDTTTASANNSHSEGYQTVASRNQAHAEGWGTVASGVASHAEGRHTIAAGQYQTAMGKFNISDTSSLLIVGKGSKEATRSNAFTVSNAGAGWFAGAVTSTGADYAEYFEWTDGNPEDEDRIGLIVTLDGEKIRLANDGDDILGVISGTAGVIGDNAAYEWKQKYLTDSYGRIVYDDPVEEFMEYTDYVDPENPETWKVVKESIGFVAHPKINPDYDPDQKYISRENRKEWDAVGMLGKLYVNDDGTCAVNSYAKVGQNGIATASSGKTNMRVMKRITDNIILVMMK